MRKAVFTALCALAMSCSAADPSVDAAGTGSSVGRVAVQIAHDHDKESVRVTSQALFVRWRGLPESTVGTLLALPGWGVDDLRAGECRTFDQAGALGDAAVAGRADVQLLDAGDIDVKTPDQLSRLLPRRYPDVLPTMSGFTYDAQSELELAGKFAVQSGGGEEIGLFGAGTDAPSPLRLVRVGRLEAAPGVPIRRGQDLIVGMDAAGATDGFVYVELETGPADARMTVRCRTAGTSAVVVPAAVLGELPSGEATLSAVHAVSAALRGATRLRRGDLWVEYRDELAVELR